MPDGQSTEIKTTGHSHGLSSQKWIHQSQCSAEDKTQDWSQDTDYSGNNQLQNDGPVA